MNVFNYIVYYFFIKFYVVVLFLYISYKMGYWYNEL